MSIKFVLVLVFMYVINGNPPKLESGEYTLEDPNIASFPGEFLMDIDGDNDMIGISMIGNEYQWMLLGLGSETLDDIVCYLYHLDNESQEMILSRILIQNGVPTEYLGKVRQWSAQVTNGYVMASFPRPFKVPGKDFDIKHKLDELPFIIGVGNGPEFNDLNDATMASYTIQLQHKLPPTSPPTLSPVVYDPFSRFGAGFGNDNDRFGGGFGMNPRGNIFENRQNPFPNDNIVNNQDRFGNDYNPFNNNNNQDRFQENNNRFNNNQNRFADARPNQDFYASNQQERNQGNNNNFYTNGFNQLQQKREMATNDFNQFSQGRGPNFDNSNNNNNNNNDRDEFFADFRKNMNDDNSGRFRNDEFFQQRPRGNQYDTQYNI